MSACPKERQRGGGLVLKDVSLLPLHACRANMVFVAARRHDRHEDALGDILHPAQGANLRLPEEKTARRGGALFKKADLLPLRARR